MIIWLASYPRSGNTFIRTLLNHAFGMKTHSIYGDKLDIAADAATSEMVGHKELPANFDFENARTSEELFFIKTHEPYGFKHESDKAIYICRDGREATVSFYHYNRNFSNIRQNYLQIINGQNFVGTWGDHCMGWKQAGEARCLYLRFETITKEHGLTIEAIEKFTGLRAANHKLPDFEELNKTNPKFFRSGKTDSFLKELTKFEQHYFWQCNGTAMHSLNYIQHIPPLPEPQERDELLFTHIRITNQLVKQYLENNINQLKNQLALKDQIIQQKNEEIIRKSEEFMVKTEALNKKVQIEKQRNEELQLTIEGLSSRVRYKRHLINKMHEDINDISQSYSFKIGRVITWPWRMLKKIK